MPGSAVGTYLTFQTQLRTGVPPPCRDATIKNLQAPAGSSLMAPLEGREVTS